VPVRRMRSSRSTPPPSSRAASRRWSAVVDGGLTEIALVRHRRRCPDHRALFTSFKAVIRRHDVPEGEWFWALEWNKSVRVAGGAGSAPAVLGRVCRRVP
jgi:hypothetical protein